MKAFRAILEEVFGLFVDDGSLAIAALVLVAAIGVLAYELPQSGPWLGLALLIGCCAILVLSTIRAGKR